MKKIINESGVAFGEFNSDDLFYIEESDLYKSLGTGIKTVEFIVLDQKDTIIFLEAKTGCPNPQNKEMGGEKTEKFVEFYNDISEIWKNRRNWRKSYESETTREKEVKICTCYYGR